MTRPGSQLTIGRLMALIAVVAVALAPWPPPIGPFLLIFLMLGGVVAVLVRTRGMTWVRAAAWIFSAYPLLVTSVVVLATTAQAKIAGPTERLIHGMIFGTLPALWLSWGCAIAEWARATRDGQDRTRSIHGLLLLALLGWPSTIFLSFLLALVVRSFHP